MWGSTSLRSALRGAQEEDHRPGDPPAQVTGTSRTREVMKCVWHLMLTESPLLPKPVVFTWTRSGKGRGAQETP